MSSTDFRRYWWAEVASQFGTVLTFVATTTIAVEYLNASTTQTGLLTAAGYLPAALLGPWVGRAADRARRPRRQLVRCDVAAGSLLAATAVAAATGHLSVLWLTGLTLLLGCIAASAETLYFLHLQSLVPAGDVPRARATLQGGEYGAGLAGNALAGLTVAALGAAAAYGIDCLTYALSAVLLLSIRRPDAPVVEDRPTAEGPPSRSRVRLRGLLRRGSFLKAVFGLLLLQSAATAAGAALLAPFLLRDLHVPASLFGLAFVATGLAGMLGSWAGPRLTRRGGTPRWFLLANAAQMLASAVLATAGGPLPLALATAGCGLATAKFSGAIANICLSTVVLADSAPGSLGRTVALLRSASTACQVAGAVGAGLLASVIGTRTTLWCAAALPLLTLPWLIRVVRTPLGKAPETAPTTLTEKAVS
ncbi:MFS transporter [Streptomyces sp. NPDC101393]|uniref:MFS transporter n=1 Tax=Streptomyces sp. NPDC101393 TaxID=3366141 RepID=UPI00380292AD